MRISTPVTVWVLGAVAMLCSCASDGEPAPSDRPAPPSTPLPPPIAGPRLAAEWEPTTGGIIGWPLIVPRGAVEEITRDADLYVMVDDASAAREATRTFDDWGIDVDRVHTIVAPAGSAQQWPRDWGPPARFSADGDFALIDTLFDEYPIASADCDAPLVPYSSISGEDYAKDDLATAPLAKALGVELAAFDVPFTGGNLLVDGMGTGFSTCAMLAEAKEHGVGEKEFRERTSASFGLTDYVVVPNFEAQGIQHIDVLLKLLDPERILVARYPENADVHDRVEEIVDELEQLTGPFGNPYEILRIDTDLFAPGQFAAYPNSLILGRKVLVPLYGIAADKQALDVWRRAMPGYDVYGFENDTSIPWLSYDAMHCRVRGVWDPQMVHIVHRRPETAEEAISVRVRAYGSGGELRENPELRWRPRGESRWRVAAFDATTEEDAFVATVPEESRQGGVEYYVSAVDASGKTATSPPSAPQGFHSVEFAN